MATLREIQQRIKGIKNTQQITKAMKMVAAAKMRRAQESMFAARPYASKIDELLKGLVAQVEDPDFPLLQVRPVERVMVVVVAADRGLCGGFNSNVLRAAVTEISRHAGKEVTVVCIGKKSHDFFRKRDYEVGFKNVGLFNHLTYVHAEDISRFLINAFTDAKVDVIKLIFNEFKSVAQQNLVVQQLLPIELEAEENGQLPDFLYEPSEAAILNSLLPRYVKVQVWRSLLESYASEQAARMIAMENATENAKELISSLTLEFNKARQAAITTEILEIVGGAEALRNA